MIALDVAALVAGIAILYWGAEWLIRGSSALARGFGVKPLVVGLTVAAFGSSSPELVVATKTALTNHAPIALGTVIGSCAANLSLILGLTALIRPPVVDGRVIKRELPVLVGSAIAVPLLFRNGVLSRLEGVLLVGCAVVFTIASLTVDARLGADLDDRESRAEEAGASLGGKGRPRESRGVAIVMSALGLMLLVVGANALVYGGRGIASELHMSERMLGLTVIALGTALPELVASVIGALRGHESLTVGTLIGSNLMNVFLVLGVTASLQPIHLGERMHLVDLVGLVAITLLGVFMMRGSRKISRFEGVVLIAAYVAFMICAATL
ncbi:MAG: calcium/sodium antiporter [Acidobacteriota bacterium]